MTETYASTATHTITSADVRQVMQAVSDEIAGIVERAHNLIVEFDAEEALVDCSIFALNDVIEDIRVQAYEGGTLISEYRFAVADDEVAAAGPEAGDVPEAPMPAGARLRLVVNANPDKPKSYAQAWFDRLGWEPAADLDVPDDASHEQYGSFVSGGYGVTRELTVNPRYTQRRSRGR
jgi:hypothetical protein